MAVNSVIKTVILFTVLAICKQGTKAQLVANFSGSPVSGCSPLIVNFIDQSLGSPNQWRWDLGNGTISILQNPSATYFTPGTYSVKLVVQNAAGSADSLTKTQYITVYNPPNVVFTGTPLTGCFPLPVQFTDQSTPGDGTINLWQWDFGDGALASVQNPAHTYTAAGNFNVSLRVRNSFGCIKILTKAQYVHINAGVHADFSNSVPNNCNPPSIINFQNLSTGTGILNYQWNFGDGGTSTLINPSHTYNSAGSYTVTLIVRNSTGCTDTLIRTNAITIGTVDASFTSADSVCVNNPIAFTNTSIPVPASVIWNFGDGSQSTVISPVKTYSAPGTYIVKLISNFGACTDSAFKTITVIDKPLVSFNANPTSSCSAPLTVNFLNNSTGGISYVWDFGDGGTSTLQNPTHTYSTTGTFNVTLTVTNSFGCTNTLVQNGLILIQAPQASINNLPRTGCAPITHTFTSSIIAVDPVASYLWDFGDGTTSSQTNPTHTFPAGTYTITLIITTAGGCSDTVIVPAGIVANTKPTANFSATPTNACAKTPINFSDLSLGNVTGWLWDFGDGGTSTDQNPIHEYQDTGYFDVKLIIWNGGCPDTILFVNYIHIDPPIAAFSPSFNCSNPKERIFTDQSIGADEWNWDFGDGSTSTIQSPTHIYANTGIYTVSLRVVNYTTGCDYTATQTIQVIIEKANFLASDTIICRNSTVQFTATGNNAANVASYTWAFGNGNTGTGISPANTYGLAGKYDVQLILTDIAGCMDTLLKPLYIQVDGPTAGFSPSVPGSCLQSAITFNDTSSTDGIHPIQTWIWNYGDGITDTLSAPPFQHTYSTPGTYTVSLIIVDSKGCIDSVTQNNAMIISHPLADFISTDTLTCPNQPVSFTNTSTGPGLNYTWHFGDGSTSTLQNPVHNYIADGTYDIKLVIVDQYGCTDSIIKPSYILIASPHAGFIMSDSVSTCPPLIVNFTNTSTGYIGVNWDFGDGTFSTVDNPSHFYSVPGTYNARLTVTGPGTCTSVISKPIVIRGPLGSFTYGPLTGCKPLQLNLTATTQDRVSFIWDFSDGTIFNTGDSVVSHTYTTLGAYVPKMILIDSGGCQVPITGPDTIRVKGVDANFNLSLQTLCDSGFVNFSDSSISNEGIVSYNWNFGDGSSSGLQNPIHHYATPGLFFPKLLVTTQTGCKDSIQYPAPVKIVASPQADFSNSPNGCAPLTATFNGNLLIADTSAISWLWNFGNGNTSTLQNPPSQIFTTAGAYPVQLIATNSSGCKDTIIKTLDAFLVPTINAGLDTMICKGTGINLNASGANNYTWSPAAGLSCINCANPVANPDSLTNYIVTGTTLQGCSNTDSVQVKVTPPFIMHSSLGDTLCKGGSVRLFATGAANYIWSPSTGLSNPTSSAPLASPATTTTYRVIGNDGKGCFRDTAFVLVKVYPIPTVNAGADKTINVGQMVDLIPAISNDVTSVLWTPTGSIFRNNFPAITVKPNETTEYTVEVKNPGGCKSTDKVTVFVVCNGANVFIPNTFSPNGDGSNDIFYPRGTGLFSIKTLRIFSRWGEIVYEKNGFMPNDASAGWNGTFKGVKLTPDVYVYTIDIICDNSTIMTFKGNVALIQ